MNDKYIKIHMINGKGYIWNADDWFTLRINYHILGSLVGSLTTATRQEDQNGLPCLLLPEEVRLLVEKNIGRTIEYPAFNVKPNHFDHIKELCDEAVKLEEIKNDYARKKADHIHKLVMDAVLSDGARPWKEVEELNKACRTIKPFDIKPYTLINLGDPRNLIMSNVLLPESMTDLETIRYKVFKDLWSKGMFLTCGLKFGGDFLVYEGDPLAYHAKYIVNCRNLDNQLMVSHSRVSSITKKKLVFAKDAGDSIKYFIYQLDDGVQTSMKDPLCII